MKERPPSVSYDTVSLAPSEAKAPIKETPPVSGLTTASVKANTIIPSALSGVEKLMRLEISTRDKD